MSMHRMVLWSIFAAVFSTSSGYGGIVAPQSLVELQQSADIVVGGTATDIFQTGTTADFSLQVSGVLKGNPAFAGGSIAVSWTNGNLIAVEAGATLPMSGTGVWFLKQAASAWRLLPVLQGSMD